MERNIRRECGLPPDGLQEETQNNLEFPKALEATLWAEVQKVNIQSSCISLQVLDQVIRLLQIEASRE